MTKKLSREEPAKHAATKSPTGSTPRSGDTNTVPLPPFPPNYRASGILLHVTSLPSHYGIGDLGPAALAWVDHLQSAGQHWWQGLPLGPTGYGDSPYQSLSSFAGNGLLISPDWLIEEGLLRASECQGHTLPTTAVDFNGVMAFKRGLLYRAWNTFQASPHGDLQRAFAQFCQEQAHWLDDYALFQALKNRHGGRHYLEWPPALVQREPHALSKARRELGDLIDRVCFAQFLFFRQSSRLRRHAHAKGVALIGDLPFFVSPDSCDVWASPELFLLDEGRRPRVVAGVPPDYFSADGQLWGNPVYDWDVLRQSGYRWYIDRVRALLAHVDMIRLDHFRGFAAAWHVPAGAPTARTGEWVLGPGADFFEAVHRKLGALPFIAEDLGLITPDVHALRNLFQIPGSRVLQFAFDGHADNPYLPHNFVSNTVVYTGTHDNPTTRGWFKDLPNDERQRLWSYLGASGGGDEEVAPALMRLAWSSSAAIAIAPLQDVLNLGNEARMNVPGQAEGNWRWRFTDDMLSASVLDWLRDLSAASNRMGANHPRVV